MKLKKNDIVKIIAGDDRGKTGKILKVFPEKGRVIVEGAAVAKKHMRQNPQDGQGGIVSRERPVDASNVALICQRCGTGIRTGSKPAPQGGSSRYCRKCGEML